MKVHIIGLAGSGKTTLAGWIGASFGVPVFDLDPVVYDAGGRERPAGELDGRVDEIRALDRWVTEGAYHDSWLLPLLDDAAKIVWLDVPLRTAMLRIVKRHVRAEIARNNAHPGWRKLARFLDYTRRTAHEQRAETRRLLSPYASKVIRCRSSRDVVACKSVLLA